MVFSSNTTDQVQKYTQSQSLLVPECFKSSLLDIKKLTSIADFLDFKAKSKRLTDCVSLT